jgi:hypothetical protein
MRVNHIFGFGLFYNSVSATVKFNVKEDLPDDRSRKYLRNAFHCVPDYTSQ